MKKSACSAKKYGKSLIVQRILNSGMESVDWGLRQNE